MSHSKRVLLLCTYMLLCFRQWYIKRVLLHVFSQTTENVSCINEFLSQPVKTYSVSALHLMKCAGLQVLSAEVGREQRLQHTPYTNMVTSTLSVLDYCKTVCVNAAGIVYNCCDNIGTLQITATLHVHSPAGTLYITATVYVHSTTDSRFHFANTIVPQITMMVSTAYCNMLGNLAIMQLSGTIWYVKWKYRRYK
jgi:hypothetical protein